MGAVLSRGQQELMGIRGLPAGTIWFVALECELWKRRSLPRNDYPLLLHRQERPLAAACGSTGRLLRLAQWVASPIWHSVLQAGSFGGGA